MDKSNNIKAGATQPTIFETIYNTIMYIFFVIGLIIIFLMIIQIVIQAKNPINVESLIYKIFIKNKA